MLAFFEWPTKPDLIPLEVNLMRNLTFPAHWHTEVELILVETGALEIGINGEFKLLQPGDIAVALSNEIHSFATSGESSIILVKFPPECVDVTGHHFRNRSFMKPFALYRDGEIDAESHRELIRLFQVMLREGNRHDEYSQWTMRGLLLQLCAALFRFMPRCEHPDKCGDITGDAGMKLVQSSLKYIEENLHRNVTLEEIARHHNVSPYYFSRVFNRVVGMNLKSYQNQLRLNRAEELITSKSIPITEIAYECGFNSVRTFNRWFQTMRGYPPSKLRKALGGNR